MNPRRVTAKCRVFVCILLFEILLVLCVCLWFGHVKPQGFWWSTKEEKGTSSYYIHIGGEKRSSYSYSLLPSVKNFDTRPPEPSSFEPRPPPPLNSSWFWLWSEKYTYLWTQTAYIDTRVNIYGNNPIVIALVHRERRPKLYKASFKWFCHIRAKNRVDTCTGLAQFDLHVEGIGWLTHSFSAVAYFICPLPSYISHKDLIGVAFSPNECKSSGQKLSPFVPIMPRNSTDSRKSLGLCLHKALFEMHDAQLLVQYIELHRLLGVELFTVYIQSISADVRDILKVYSRQGLMEIIDWNISISPKVIRDYGQVGVIHDCLLRNRDRVKYLGFSDFDEVFMPFKYSSLVELLSAVDKPSYGSFRFMHVFMHESNIPTAANISNFIKCSKVRYPYYFTHRIRSDYNDSKSFYGDNLGSKGKIIVKPEAIIRMGRHSMKLTRTHKFAPGFKEVMIPGNKGLLFHYRNRIQRQLEKRSLVQDNALMKYRSQLMNALNHKLCKVT